MVYNIIDSDPTLYPIYNNSDFMINDPSFMRHFSKEDPYYLETLKKSSCKVDISNIIPASYLKNSVDLPLPTTEKENKARIPKVDAELIEREEWGRDLKSYEEMRESARYEMDGIYANDHIELRHAKTMYKSIHELELDVVEKMIDRMNATKCFDSVFDRYNEMTRELSLERMDEWNLLKNQIVSTKKGNSLSENELSQQVNDAFNHLQDERKKQRLHKYYNDDYFTNSTSEYCDGCAIVKKKGKPLYTKYLVSKRRFNNGLLIRKWIGNTETEDITSVDHR